MYQIKKQLISKFGIPDDVEHVSLYELSDRITRCCEKFCEEFIKAQDSFVNFCSKNNINEIEEKEKLYAKKWRPYVNYLKSDLSREFNECNEIFRKYLGVKPKSKKYSVFTLSYCKDNVTDYIRWDYVFDSNSKTFKKKPKLSHKLLMPMVEGAFKILRQKFNDRVYEFQFTATLYKIIIDYFDLSMCDTFMFQLAIRSAYELSVEESSEPKVKEKRKKRKDVKDYPTTQQYLQMKAEGKKNREIQKLVSQMLHCSERSVRNDMALKGITDQKYTTKKNKHE